MPDYCSGSLPSLYLGSRGSIPLFGFMSNIKVKPWGYEVLIEKNDKYVIKHIIINAGHRLSLQYHERKMETLMLISGPGYMICQDEKDGTLYKLLFDKNTSKTVRPGSVHRLGAEVTGDVVFLEVSTPELDDVIRLEDDYKRV